MSSTRYIHYVLPVAKIYEYVECRYSVLLTLIPLEKQCSSFVRFASILVAWIRDPMLFTFFRVQTVEILKHMSGTTL
jgi:hypothetical protein